jgi:hypothetical protein
MSSRFFPAKKARPIARIAQSVKTILVLGICVLTISCSHDLIAEAKKKAAGPDPATQAEETLKKDVGPLSEKITGFMVKEESRILLSPKEAGELAELKFKLMDLMNDNPQNALLAKPLYQGAVLLSLREEYNDAYELFSSVAQNYPSTPYGLKAKGQIAQLEKRLGPVYFAVETASAAPAANPGTTAATSAPSSATSPVTPATKK